MYGCRRIPKLEDIAEIHFTTATAEVRASDENDTGSGLHKDNLLYEKSNPDRSGGHNDVYRAQSN